jgi:SagB-type dehydrogenase family enzyme
VGAPPKKKSREKQPALVISVRVPPYINLHADAAGNLSATADQGAVSLDNLTPQIARQIDELRRGVPIEPLAPQQDNAALYPLIRRLAVRGLVEYVVSLPPDGGEAIVIEPQMRDYWPRLPELADGALLALSRFAYMRRRGDAIVLESPRAGALFRLCQLDIAAAVAQLAIPQPVARLCERYGVGFRKILALMLDCQILYEVDAENTGFRESEGDDDLLFWDFHDLLFHARSTQGRHANPSGGAYAYAGRIPPLPAVRPTWPGKKIGLRKYLPPGPVTASPFAKLLRERRSARIFDDRQPLTLAELSHFLAFTARIYAKWKGGLDFGDSVVIEYAARPYPCGGGSYELELYLAVGSCEGLAAGFYHYDADKHALVSIGVRDDALKAMMKSAEFAMGAPAPPPILITIAARFGRVSWKYSGIAYALILKDVGILMQTFYLMATEMGIGGCAVGTTDIDLFAKMTGIAFHVEGAVGQFAIGRPAESESRSTSDRD